MVLKFLGSCSIVLVLVSFHQLFVDESDIICTWDEYQMLIGMLIEQAKVAFIKLFAQTPNSKVVFENLFKMGCYV